MKSRLGPRDALRLARMTPDELREFLSKCTPRDFLLLDAQFEIWAANGQIAPEKEGWRVWLMMAGRGFGKTRAGAEWVNDLASGLKRRIALVGATIDEARSVMVEGVSGILAVARRRRIPVKWEPSLGKLTWPMGSIAELYSGDSPNGLRGPEHHFAWVLSFEAEAEEEPVSIADIVTDASGGLIEPGESRTVDGYAAHGSSIGDSIRPLIEHLDLPLADRGGKLCGPIPSAPVQLLAEELGCDADATDRPMIERVRTPDASLPASRAILYYDPERDFQAGQMRASSGGGGKIDEQMELPAALGADEAKRWVEEGLARRWQAAGSVRLRLPPSRIGLVPGDRIRLPGSMRSTTVRKVEIYGMAVVVEAATPAADLAPLPADPGRAIPDPDEPVGRTEIVLFELPALGDTPEFAPKLLAAGSNDGRWKPVPIEVRLGSEPMPAQAVSRRAVLGRSTTVLDARVPLILDELSSVTVRLINPGQVLLNADADAMTSGANLAMIGDELIQFGRAEQMEPGLFRLSKLLRGRRGTEWAGSSHEVGEGFCLFNPAALTEIEVTAGGSGGSLSAIAHGVGDAAPLPEATRLVSGEAMRPPSVCHLRAWRDGSSVCIGWTRRSLRGWAWSDSVGVPADSFPETYRLTVTGPGGQLQQELGSPVAILDAASLPAAAGQATEIEVRTVGPMAVSRPRKISIIL